MMELYLLEQLIAFSRQGTLSGAAEKLHISQPALSQSMKKLEESLGLTVIRNEITYQLLADGFRVHTKLPSDS